MSTAARELEQFGLWKMVMEAMDANLPLDEVAGRLRHGIHAGVPSRVPAPQSQRPVSTPTIAIHKERQIERGLVQVADVGATDPADVTVHASFISLISASIGMILYAIGLFQVIGNPTGTREGWILEVLGMTLLSIGISHSTTTTKSWQVMSGYGTGAAWLCFGIAVGLVILLKRSIEAESAKS